MLINNATYQRKTLSEPPIRQPLMHPLMYTYSQLNTSSDLTSEFDHFSSFVGHLCSHYNPSDIQIQQES